MKKRSNKEKWSYLINKKILDNFVEEIVSNSINLEGEIVDMVNKHFWELI